MSQSDELRKVAQMMTGWRYVGLLQAAAGRLDQLEVENTRLRKLVADELTREGEDLGL